MPSFFILNLKEGQLKEFGKEDVWEEKKYAELWALLWKKHCKIIRSEV